MLATTTRTAADLPGEPSAWQVEPKLDGLRCIAVRNGGDVTLWSRNRLPWTGRFPAVVAALASLSAESFVLDGEMVSYDTAGRTSFGQLQSGRSGEPVLVVFDLMALLGRDVTTLAIEERRRLLAMLVAPLLDAGGGGGPLRLVQVLEGAPDELLDTACRAGWEGIVVKRRGSPYTAGRSPSWRKLKCSASQELVVGGWTLPTGSRHGLGALMVGYHDDGGLRYAGKVGTGFSDRTLRELAGALERRASPASPFTPPPKVKGARWAVPELVVEVSFTEWTADGRLRHPSFKGLRDDRDPLQVVRELPPS